MSLRGCLDQNIFSPLTFVHSLLPYGKSWPRLTSYKFSNTAVINNRQICCSKLFPPHVRVITVRCELSGPLAPSWLHSPMDSIKPCKSRGARESSVINDLCTVWENAIISSINAMLCGFEGQIELNSVQTSRYLAQPCSRPAHQLKQTKSQLKCFMVP